MEDSRARDGLALVFLGIVAGLTPACDGGPVPASPVVTAEVAGSEIAAGAPNRPEPGKARELERQWAPVLGAEGRHAADDVIADLAPGCIEPESPEALDRWVASTRARLVESLGLDTERPPLSAVLRRSLPRDGYGIDVVRMEVFPGLYLPLNVYVPTRVGPDGAPLVLTPTGCSSAVWHEHVQARAASLARLGMLVVVSDGFCDNGERAGHAISNPRIGYARQLLGMPGDFTVYVQELISAINWVLDHYPVADRGRIGAAGYSYGGQISSFLAVLDSRVLSLSAPATAIGNDCGGFRLESDIALASDSRYGPDFVWSSPLEIPLQTVNWRLSMLYPRYVHTTAGAKDESAHPSVIGEAVAHARTLYDASGLGNRILYRTDDEDHNYGRNRREDTYSWFAHTLLGEPLTLHPEQPVELCSRASLSTDITGTTTLWAGLKDRVDSELGRRFVKDRPLAAARVRAVEALRREYGGAVAPLRGPAQTVWDTRAAGIRVTARRVPGDLYPLAVFTFERSDRVGAGTLLFLPRRGTRPDLDWILGWLDQYGTVISVDYLGIGELASDRILLHSLARHFMHNRPSLPRINVDHLRAWVESRTEPSLDVYGHGWASAFCAVALKHLVPDKLGRVRVSGVPANELKFLSSGRKIPDLLLHGGLFSELTVAELAGSPGGGDTDPDL